MHSQIVNNKRYDDSEKSIKQISFIVKNLGGNLPKKQSIIIKRNFRSSTKPLSLNSTNPIDELTAKIFTASKHLNSLIYERSTHNHNWNLQLTSRTSQQQLCGGCYDFSFFTNGIFRSTLKLCLVKQRKLGYKTLFA